MMKSGKSYRREKLLGSQEPSVRIAPKYTVSDSFDALKILKVGGTNLDEWQATTLDDWMSRSPSGRWAATTCGLSVPRQNGKTFLVQGRVAPGMIMFNEQIIYTAHLQKTATETFEELRNFFETPKLKAYVADIKAAIGREQIVLKSGARIKFLARTRNGGRGQHGDLLIFDEAQELDEDQQASFLPAISASLNPQTLYIGTPPDPTAAGTVFRTIRTKALEKKTSSTAWIEFGVKEIGDITDRRRWAQANPALGHRILESTIESEFEQMDPDTFARERLGWWSLLIMNEKYAIDKKAWMSCVSAELKPEGKTAYGIKFSSDGSQVYLCGAVCPNGRPARISLIESRPTSFGIQWLADWLNERYKQASCVVIDGRNGVDLLIDKIKDIWRLKGTIITPNAKDVIAVATLLVNEVNEKTVTWYKGQEALKDSAFSVTKRPIGAGWGFGGDNSAPIEACALALWGARTSKRDPTRKMRIG